MQLGSPEAAGRRPLWLLMGSNHLVFLFIDSLKFIIQGKVNT